jgi:hypothetical protein
MKYWRMQLHPNRPSKAMQHAVESLAAGFIGLDFLHDPGDLTQCDVSKLSPSEQKYVALAKQMKIGHKVLVIAHHFPFALATVDGDYNYTRQTLPQLGVWFRHFRAVKDVKYFGDWITNAKKWPNLVMTDTLSPLVNPGVPSYKLIDDWP